MQTPVHLGVWQPRSKSAAARPVFVQWRDLTFHELRRIAARNVHQRILFCDIYETCLHQGPALESVPAGIVAWIASRELEQNPFSGKFAPLKKALDQGRQKVADSWFSAARAVLASLFHYTFEEIDRWPPDVFFERVAQAEVLTGNPLEPADSNAPSAKGTHRVKKQTPPRPQQKAPDKRGGNVDRTPEIDIQQQTWTKGSRK